MCVAQVVRVLDERACGAARQLQQLRLHATLSVGGACLEALSHEIAGGKAPGADPDATLEQTLADMMHVHKDDRPPLLLPSALDPVSALDESASTSDDEWGAPRSQKRRRYIHKHLAKHKREERLQSNKYKSIKLKKISI